MSIEVVQQGTYIDKYGRPCWKTHYRTPDGKEWHEAKSGRELADLPGDALVIVGRGDPEPKSRYDGIVIAGAPFLPAIAHLMPVYIEGEKDYEDDSLA